MLVLRAGGKVLVGLTRENITRLIAGKPIHFTNTPMPELRDVGIMFGETKIDILKQLEAAGVDVSPAHYAAAEEDPL